MVWSRGTHTWIRRWLGNGVSTLLIITMIMGGVLIGARPAQADPHAIFYTAIGQQQLFFNVLAALDQADYVEPATGDPSREELLKKRKELDAVPKYAAETEELAKSTKTDLAAILTREITLSGNDRFTEEQLRDLAAETRRVASTAELARIYCEYAFGLPQCDEEYIPEAFSPGGGGGGGIVVAPTNGVFGQVAQAQIGILPWPIATGALAWAAKKPLLADNRFLSNPVHRWLGDWFIDGVIAALDSGTVRDQSERKERVDANEKLEPEKKKPYAKASSIAFWRGLIRNMPNAIYGIPGAGGPAQLALLERLLAPVPREYLADDGYQYPYGKMINTAISPGDPPSLELVPQITINGGLYQYVRPNITDLDDMAALSMRVALAPATVTATASSAARRIIKQQGAREQDGFKAKSDLFQWQKGIPVDEDGDDVADSFIFSAPAGHEEDPKNKEYGELSIYITNPAEITAESGRSVGDALTQGNQIAFAAGSAEGVQSPGEHSLIIPNAEPEEPESPGLQLQNIGAGPSDPQEGQVAGELNFFDPTSFFFDQERVQKTSPLANIIFPHLEQGLLHALSRVTADTFRGGGPSKGGKDCGFTC